MRLRLPRLPRPRLSLPHFGIITRFREWVMGAGESDAAMVVLYDRTLLWLTFGLAAVGFIMVTSASMPIGQRLADDPFLFAKQRQFGDLSRLNSQRAKAVQTDVITL